MSKKTSEHLQNLKNLLEIELEENRKLSNEQIFQISIGERKQKGICWFPIQIIKSSIGLSNRLILDIERRNKNLPHRFKSGQTVLLFSENNPQNQQLSAVIHFVKPKMMRIVLDKTELPDWIDDEKIGINIFHDERSFREMFRAMEIVENAERNQLAELREILIGNEFPEHHRHKLPFSLPKLNASQEKAVKNALLTESVEFIHGPPGTGKTTTMLEIIAQTLKHEKQVLVCAPSNNAVDLLAGKLSKKNIDVLRIGHPARVSQELLNLGIDVKVQNHPDYKQVKQLKRRADEARRNAQKFKRSFGAKEREERRQLYRESRNLLDDALQFEEQITDEIIRNAQVICTTLVGAASGFLKELQFSTVFIDEAAQALEPATWIPILKAEKLVFAGDHFQLPPTVKSNFAAENGLNISLFEKFLHEKKQSNLLNVQYRMHAEIMNFSSRIFYKNELKADESLTENVLNPNSENNLLSKSVMYIDTAGCGFDEEKNKETLSTFNKEEANLLINHLEILKQSLESENIDYPKIGIISPYQAQVATLKELFEKKFEESEFTKNISINTVDGFQGQEREVIYISLVRSNEKSEIGFLKDIRRMNVAMTRAQKKLIVIGDSATIAKHDFYQNFLDYIDEIGAYHSAWEFISF